MRRKLLFSAFSALLLLLLAARAKKPATSSNPPAGTRTGDSGPDRERRESVSLELRWEGTDLRGEVQALRRTLPLSKASFNPDTGAITMEFDAEGNGQTVHYVIDGKVDGKTMAGSWAHGEQRGDF